VRSPAIPMALAVWFAAGTVSAQPIDEGTGPDPAAEGGERKMTMPAERALVQVFGEISLSQDAALEPLSIAPDLWYGVSDELTVGLVHSGRGRTGFFGGAGNGLCLTGEEGGCGKIYNSVGVGGRYHFYREGAITAAADGGLYALAIDPFRLAIKVGATGRWESGMLAVEASPSLFGGLTGRTEDVMGVEVATNKEAFLLPVTALYALTPQLGLAVQAGLQTPFEDLGDLWTFGMSIGAQYMVNQQIFADLAFSLPALVGGPDNTGADLRTLTLGVGYAM
jgi:hypothetical protein